MEPEQSTVGAAVPGLLQSPTLGKLAAALARAQGEIKPPIKSKMGHVKGTTAAGKAYDYEYKYADLADVIESRRVAAKHELAITQGMEMSEGNLVLSTILMHSSGEWKRWECPIPLGLKPQELGSYLTYMRRYSECGVWGIAAEDDDDGKRAQDAQPTKQQEPLGADAAAILDCAAELEQITGKSIDLIIKEASSFEGKDGKTVFFTDPAAQRSAKWLKGVRVKLEKSLHELGAMAEVGPADVPF